MTTDRCDPRVVRSRQRMIESAIELLREGGATALTIEAAAARSGVAKTTIYRHFADRDALHVAALEACEGAKGVDDTGDIYADIESWMQRFAVALYTADFASLLPTVIDAAERSPQMALLATEMTSQRRSVLVGRLRTAVRRGELAAGVDAEFLAGQLASPLFYRRFISRQPLPKRFVSRVVQAVLGPVLASSPHAESTDTRAVRRTKPNR
jgi:AcrR family transcriptional regulator